MEYLNTRVCAHMSPPRPVARAYMRDRAAACADAGATDALPAELANQFHVDGMLLDNLTKDEQLHADSNPYTIPLHSDTGTVVAPIRQSQTTLTDLEKLQQLQAKMDEEQGLRDKIDSFWEKLRTKLQLQSSLFADPISNSLVEGLHMHMTKDLMQKISRPELAQQVGQMLDNVNAESPIIQKVVTLLINYDYASSHDDSPYALVENCYNNIIANLGSVPDQTEIIQEITKYQELHTELSAVGSQIKALADETLDFETSNSTKFEEPATLAEVAHDDTTPEFASRLDIIQNWKQRMPEMSAYIDECDISTFFEANRGNNHVHYEPNCSAHKQDRHGPLTGEEHIPQLKLEVSMRIAILEYMQTQVDTRRLTNPSWTMHQQLKNTVVVYAGAHHSHADTKRSHIHILLQEFPHIRMVLIDYDQQVMAMEDGIEVEDRERVAVIHTKFTEQKAERAAKWLSAQKLDILFVSDIRSELRMDALQSMTRLFASSLRHAQDMPKESRERRQLMKDALQFAQTVIEMQLARESQVARDDNNQGRWARILNCCCRLKGTVPYPIPAAQQFIDDKVVAEICTKEFLLPTDSFVLLGQPFSNNSTEMSVHTRPLDFRDVVSEWTDALFEQFYKLFVGTSRADTKTSWGRSTQLEGGEFTMKNAGAFPKNLFNIHSKDAKRVWTWQEWDDLYRLYADTGAKRKVLHLADAMYMHFYMQLPEDIQSKAKKAADTQAYKELIPRCMKTIAQKHSDTICFDAMQYIDRNCSFQAYGHGINANQREIIATLNAFVDTELPLKQYDKKHFTDDMFAGGQRGERMKLIQEPVNNFMSTQNNFALSIGKLISNAAVYWMALAIDMHSAKPALGGLDIRHPFGIPEDMKYFAMLLFAHCQRCTSGQEFYLDDTTIEAIVKVLKHNAETRFRPSSNPKDNGKTSYDKNGKKLDHKEAADIFDRFAKNRKKWKKDTSDLQGLSGQSMGWYFTCKACQVLIHPLVASVIGMRQELIQIQTQDLVQRIERRCLAAYQACTTKQTLQNLMPFTPSRMFNVSIANMDKIVTRRSYLIEVFSFLLTLGPETDEEAWKQWKYLFHDGWKIRMTTRQGTHEFITDDKYNVFNFPPGAPIFLCFCERGMHRIVKFILSAFYEDMRKLIGPRYYGEHVKRRIQEEQTLVECYGKQFLDRNPASRDILQKCLQAAVFYGHPTVIEILLNSYRFFSREHARTWHLWTGTYTIGNDIDAILEDSKFKTQDENMLSIFAPWPIKDRKIVQKSLFVGIKGMLQRYWIKQALLAAKHQKNAYKRLQANILFLRKRAAKEKENVPDIAPASRLLVWSDKFLEETSTLQASARFVSKYFPVNICEALYNLVHSDEEAGYSWTAQNHAATICDLICQEWQKIQPDPKSKPTIVDATAGAGGNSAAFMCSRLFRRVIAVEISQRRFNILKDLMLLCRRNGLQTGIVDVVVVQANINKLDKTLKRFFRMSQSNTSQDNKWQPNKPENLQSQIADAEIIFLDPPWGGIDYRESPLESLKLYDDKYWEVEYRQTGWDVSTDKNGKPHTVERYQDGLDLAETVKNMISKCPKLKMIFIKIPFSSWKEQTSAMNGKLQKVKWEVKDIETTHAQNLSLSHMALLYLAPKAKTARRNGNNRFSFLPEVLGDGHDTVRQDLELAL